MPVRLRLPELMHERGFPSAYALAKASNGRLAERTVSRLVSQRGRVKLFDGDVLEALAGTLGVPVGELFEQVSIRGRRP